MNKKQEKEQDKIMQKVTVRGKIWFWLTSLRPLTKIEAAHMAQSIVQNRQMLNKLAMQSNNQALKIAEIIGFIKGRDSIKSDEQVSENLEKQETKKKDDVMYR